MLCTFKEQLQQHVRVHAVEAVMACRDIESTLQALTGTLFRWFLLYAVNIYYDSQHGLRNFFVQFSFYLFSDSFVGFNYYANKGKA